MFLTHKARLVSEGHKTVNPAESMYVWVAPMETVQIEFTYDTLNELYIMAADIQNAYLTAPSSKEFFIFCCPEFGLDNIVKRVIV